VRTSGKRKGDKVCGLLDDVSGRFCHKAQAGRFHAASSAAFFLDVLSQPRRPVIVLHDGARYHPRQAMSGFCAAQAQRLTSEPLPASSPAGHSIDHLGKQGKVEGDRA
jgi:hypothetical protein